MSLSERLKEIRLWGKTSTFWSSFWGGQAYTGKSVTVDTALNVSAVWACVRLLSETVGTLPLFVYQIDKDGKKTKATENEWYKVLHDAVNNEMSAAEAWEAAVAYLCTDGNAYFKKLRKSLLLLESPKVNPVRKDNGDIIYEYTPEGKTKQEIKAKDIIHIKGF